MLNRPDEGGPECRPGTFGRAQAALLEQLFTIHSMSCDLRWALFALAAGSVVAMLASARRHAASQGRRLARRARFASYFTPAATMVAAGGR